jgi:hypothetical protein
MQDIVEKLKSYAGQAGEGLNKGMSVLKDKASQAGDYLEANPTLAAMLLAGGGAGLLGGYLTSQQEEDESESKMQRRGRILRNALLAGAAGAGAIGLGAAGYKRLAEATPAGSKNPVQEKLTSPFARGAGAAGLGALGFVKGRGMDDLVTASEARSYLSPADQIKVKGMKPEEVIDYATHPTKGFRPKPSGFGNPIAGHSTRLDNATDKVVKTIKKSPFLTKALKLLVGTSRAGQLARLGGGAGLLLPELISGAKDLVLQE